MGESKEQKETCACAVTFGFLWGCDREGESPTLNVPRSLLGVRRAKVNGIVRRCGHGDCIGCSVCLGKVYGNVPLYDHTDCTSYSASRASVIYNGLTYGHNGCSDYTVRMVVYSDDNGLQRGQPACNDDKPLAQVVSVIGRNTGTIVVKTGGNESRNGLPLHNGSNGTIAVAIRVGRVPVGNPRAASVTVVVTYTNAVGAQMAAQVVVKRTHWKTHWGMGAIVHARSQLDPYVYCSAAAA